MGVSFTMGTPWLALIIPIFAVLCLLCFMVMPGVVYSGEHKVTYIGVAKKLFDLFGEHHRIAVLIGFFCLPIIVGECIFGLYQRNTSSKTAKVLCNIIALLGAILIWGLYLPLTYVN